jgi:hypothetical protein
MISMTDVDSALEPAVVAVLGRYFGEKRVTSPKRA